MNLTIKITTDENDYHESAQLFTVNDPWKSLGRTYDYSLKKVKDSNQTLYVAKHEGRVVGCLLLQYQGPLEVFVRGISIDVKYQGQGIGSKLLRQAEEEIFKEYKNIFLFVNHNNTKALNWYLSSGYEFVGIIKDFAQSGLHEILLRKTIGVKESSSSIININKCSS